MKSKTAEAMLVTVAFVVIVAAVLSAFGVVMMFAWNVLIADILGAPAITFLQSVALLIVIAAIRFMLSAVSNTNVGKG